MHGIKCLRVKGLYAIVKGQRMVLVIKPPAVADTDKERSMQKIGIGYEDYKRVIDDNTYYIDKTMLISDIVEKGGMVTLFTRPRRFGKTLALSMLRTFFELEYDSKGSPVDKDTLRVRG